MQVLNKPKALELADTLERIAEMQIHLDCVAELRRLYAELESVPARLEQAEKEGRRDGLYAARNAINIKFGL